MIYGFRWKVLYPNGLDADFQLVSISSEGANASAANGGQ